MAISQHDYDDYNYYDGWQHKARTPQSVALGTIPPKGLTLADIRDAIKAHQTTFVACNFEKVWASVPAQGIRTASPSAVFQPKKETSMSISDNTYKAVETKTYVFGRDVTTVSDDHLFATVADLEKQIKSLDGIENKSAKLTKKIESLKADIKAINDVIDSRD